MLVILAVLLLTLVLGGVGFAVHILWYIAAAMLVLWLVGFLVHTSSGKGHWYHW